MDEREAIWFAHQRRRWMRPDADRFIRPDAYRFMPPGSSRWVGKDAVRYFWPERKDQEPARVDDGVDAIDMEALVVRGNLHRLRRELAEVRFELKFRRFLHALKYGYNPDQPRVPAGNPEGGQWTSGGGGSTGQNRIRLAGEIPTNDPPEIPKKRPPTAKMRNRIIKAVARWLLRNGGSIGKILEIGSWLNEAYPYIQAYRDPPKTLEELQEAVSSPAKGYEIHHIVEQTSAEQDGFPRSMIDAPDNLVRIPTLKHREINGWYQTKNKVYDFMSPRNYLHGKSWQERRRVGIDALIQYGVLEP